MRETERIIDELQRATRGDPWHGPSVRAALDGVTLAIATARPVPGAHTICELILHLTAWTREVSRRVQRGIAQDPADGDWPQRRVTSEHEWAQVQAGFDAAHDALVAAVAALADSHLDDLVTDARDTSSSARVSHYVMLHGLAQHHAYHAGQIAVLKAAAHRQ